MPDLDVQLRAYLDATTDPVTVGDIAGRGGVVAGPSRRPRSRIRLAAAAAVVVVAGVGALVLSTSDRDSDAVVVTAPGPTTTETVPEPTPTLAPPSTRPATTTAPVPPPTDDELMISALLTVSELTEFSDYEVEGLHATDDVLPLNPPAGAPGFEIVMQRDGDGVDAPYAVAVYGYPDAAAAAEYLQMLRTGAIESECEASSTVIPPCTYRSSGRDAVDRFVESADPQRGDESLVVGFCMRGCAWAELTRVDRWLISRRTGGNEPGLPDLVVKTVSASLASGSVRSLEFETAVASPRDTYVRQYEATLRQPGMEEEGWRRGELSVMTISAPVKVCSNDHAGFETEHGGHFPSTELGTFRELDDGTIEGRRPSYGVGPIILPADHPDYLQARAACDRFGLSVADFGLRGHLEGAEAWPVTDQVTSAPDGSYRLRVVEWRYDLDARAAADAGLLELGSGAVVERFVVVVDASRTWVDAIEMTVAGPPDAVTAPLGVDPSPYHPDRAITVEFRLRIWADDPLAMFEFTSAIGFEPSEVGLPEPE